MAFSSDSASCSVFLICCSIAARLLMVCFSHTMACSALTNRRSDSFTWACIRGSRMPASFMPCAVPVPGREDPVLGREPVSGLAVELRVSPIFMLCVRRKVAGSSSPLSLFSSGLSSKYSSDASPASARCSSSPIEQTGLSWRLSSLIETRGCSISTSWIVSRRFLPRSRISTEGKVSPIASGISSISLPDRFSSISWSSGGRFRNAFAVSRFPDASRVARFGRHWGAPCLSEPARKDRLCSWFPPIWKSSSFARPRSCSAVTCVIWFWLTQSTSRAVRPSSPSRDWSLFRDRCSSRSFASLARLRPIVEILLPSRFKYSRNLRWSRPSMALMVLSCRCREAKLTQDSRLWIREIWHP
mmetsp:Transcript_30150/g.84972  ORF Transcript_30150/g.84972 Transcript_30150/m.84972 type:complete len:358 (+) Transcript_30150:154-1227(+)